MNDLQKLSGLRLGFAVCGSFCTFAKAFGTAEKLVKLGCEVTPIMSFNAAALDTRFGSARDNITKITEITGKEPLCDIPSTEPIGPNKMFDALVVAPCTGNTLAKLALGIVDTAVVHLRKQCPKK